MKRRLLLLLSALFMLAAPIAVMSPAQAAVDPFQDVCEDAQTDGQNPVCDRSGNDNPISGEDGVILRVVRIVSFVIGVAAVLMLMLGGLKYITSNGDPNSISSAKNTIIYALIGLALAAFSQAIVIFVLSRL
jgi:TRAP-type C4-dicarboxylate transport system permease small subunit